MPDIHIQRDHDLGLAQARKLAFRWAELAQEKFDMACSYEEGKAADLVTFSRSGVNGELKVTGDAFVLDARLGFLLGVFKERIETEIVKNLDELLAQEEPLKALDVAVARHGAKAAKTAAKKPAAKKKA
ncbi:polyhydroxyalkanoic acid system family protein [Caenimonas terrae]|uniref:Polyhydroxyalkanoic acid system family protein n=1 Tax=Caenimonas terrae TaxID=696074 RepID=A0ABW0NJP0_9BURK